MIGCGCLELYGSIRGGIGQRQEAMTVAEYIDYRKVCFLVKIHILVVAYSHGSVCTPKFC